MRSHDAKGVVDFLNETGGYGFIVTDEVEDDVFFHMEDVGGPDLQEGSELAFDIVQTENGPRATNINRLGTKGQRREAKGVVDFFNETGGYGFIESDQTTQDVFYHMEDIEGPDLVEGTEVAFDIEYTALGPRATNIKREPNNVIILPDSTAEDESADNAEVYTGDKGDSSGTDTKVFAGNESAAGQSTSDSQTSTDGVCPQCGTNLEDHTNPNFCPECGTKL